MSEWVSEWADSKHHISTIRLHSAIHIGTRCWKIGQKTNQEQTIQNLSRTHKKQTTQNTAKQSLVVWFDLVSSYDTRPGNKVDLSYKARETTKTLHRRLVVTCSSSFVSMPTLLYFSGLSWKLTIPSLWFTVAKISSSSIYANNSMTALNIVTLTRADMIFTCVIMSESTVTWFENAQKASMKRMT